MIAPADAKVEAIFPTGHAVALNTVDGLDVLIHVGLDTVQLEGKHFTVHAQVGDIVHKGDVLIEFDREAIAAEGYDVTVPILVCNSVEFSSIKAPLACMSKRWTSSSLLASASKCTWPLAYNSNTFTEGALKEDVLVARWDLSEAKRLWVTVDGQGPRRG